MPSFREPAGSAYFEDMEKEHVEKIDGRLKSAFEMSGPARFMLRNLGTGPCDEDSPELPTWLGRLARHNVISMPNLFNAPDEAAYAKCQTVLDFPEALRWAGGDGTALSTTYIRVQRAVGTPGCADHNDRMVTLEHPDNYTAAAARALEELREFFAWIFARRRNEIFASNFSERIYHIWLPPGLLSRPSADRGDGGPVAVLPMVTLVRRPSQLEWRHTICINILFVPVSRAGGGMLHSRLLVRPHSQELEFLVRCLEGGSTVVRPAARDELILEDCPLRQYAAGLMAARDASSVLAAFRPKISGNWTGTRRKWIEFVAAIAADAIGEWNADRSLYQQQLADGVLRSLRLASIWSVMLSGGGLHPLEVRDGRRWPARLRSRGERQQGDLTEFPAWAAATLKSLSSSGEPPVPGDRIDDITCTDTEAMTWRVPRRRCLITMLDISENHFPGYSLLTTLGWTGHMVIGAASASGTMQELGRLISRSQPDAGLARIAYEFTLELEEMYDLDVTWLMYARFFRKIRRSLGLDKQYRGIRERVDLLAGYAEVQDRARKERQNVVLAEAGTALAISLIVLAAFTAPIHVEFKLLAITLSILAVIVVWVWHFTKFARRDKQSTSSFDQRREP